MGHFWTYYEMENLTEEDYADEMMKIMDEFKNISNDVKDNNVLEEKAWRIFIITLYAVVIVVGFVKNLVVFTVIVKSKQLHTVTNIFIATLALSDIMLCVFNLPFQLHYQMTSYWSFGRVLCHTIMPLFAVPIFVSTAAMLMIAIDRYMLIVYPFMDRMTNKTAIIIIILIVVLTICFAIPSILHMQLHEVDIPEVNYHSSQCIENWPSSSRTEQFLYSTGVFVVQFAIPLIIIAILYFRIFLVLKNRPNKRHDVMRNQKTNKILVAIVLLFTIFWLPWNLFGLILSFKSTSILNSSFKPYINVTDLLLKIIAMSTACVNPYLYGWLNDNFRKGLENMFHGRCKLKQFQRCSNGVTMHNPSRTIDVGLTTAL